MKNYNQQNWIKLGLMAFAMLIAFASLYYTNDLVRILGEREKKLIDLYAKGLQTAALAEDAGNLGFLFQEIIHANTSVPVILADSKQNPLSSKNVPLKSGLSKSEENLYLQEEMKEMATIYEPIAIEFSPGLRSYVYYKNSPLLNQLKFYPYIQLTVIFVFIFLGYLVINNSRRAEQNRIWVGMAKETAHQLGTPISSLMAWTELFKIEENFSHPDAVTEMEKDIHRLETVVARFSNIGSVPHLKPEPLFDVICSFVGYLKNRVSGKVEFVLENDLGHKDCKVDLNKPLFEWVLENIIKNGVDAMSGTGKITINLSFSVRFMVALEISDTGKGISKRQIKNVFKAGFTTKQRGWGLGLTLAKRIIEEYHKGKISAISSGPGKGTTFRILIGPVIGLV